MECLNIKCLTVWYSKCFRCQNILFWNQSFVLKTRSPRGTLQRETIRLKLQTFRLDLDISSIITAKLREITVHLTLLPWPSVAQNCWLCLLLVAFLFCLQKHIQHNPVFYVYLLAKKQEQPIKYENIFHFPPVAFLICSIYSKWDGNGIISISSAPYLLYLSFGHHLSNLLTIIRP